LSRRFKEYYNYNHIYKVKRNYPILSAILKYGYSSIKLEILEYCERNILIKKEQYYLDLLKPKYNILKIAGSMLGFKHSKSTKKLFRITRLDRLFS
jgi:group I intron endonuclease